MHTAHSCFCSGLCHAPWSLKSVLIHDVTLLVHPRRHVTVFCLVSTTPRFHHPFCLRARLLTLTSLWGLHPPSLLLLQASLALSCFDYLFHRRQFCPRVQTLLVCSPPFISRFHTTQSFVRSHSSRPSLSRPSHIKTVGPCSFPQIRTVPLPAFGRKGGAATADSPCSCVAESRACRARSTLHVGDRYPAASSRSWCCTFSRMNIAILRSSSPLLLRTWLYAPKRPKITRQLL
jgi:hypothetical protein